MGPELQAALKGFREDLRAFFKAQEQHHVTRQRLEDLYLRLLLQPTASPQPVASAPPPAAKPLAPAARNPAAAAPAPTVGIAGVGKGEDSPDSKGAKAKRQAISLQELGGEAAIWSLVAEHLAELRKNMQDVWVDEVSQSSARVSVLLSHPKPECMQLALQHDGTRWQVAKTEDSPVPVAGSLDPAKDVRDLWSPVAKEIEAGRLRQDFDLSRLRADPVKDPDASSNPRSHQAVQVSKPQQPSKLVGKSPFFRLKDASKLFDEIDADGDGLLGREDLLPFLRDYLGYGHAEVLNFLKVHGAGSGVELADFKRGLKDLNPYAVHDRTTQLLVRKPGAFGGIEGVDFHLEDCKGCSVLICDKSEEFKVDALANCRVLIGPCTSSSFIRNCENCTFWVATRQFRVRDCSNCTFYLHCHTEPVIESSKELRIAPFNAKYPGLPKQFEEAGFDATKNYWNAVYDFTGNAKSANWSIPPLDQCEELIITFEGSSAAPEPATPELTQEMLLAAPLESGESHGQSVTNVPQTRPSLPDSPGLKRLRRCLTDAVQELAGTLEAVVLSPEKPVEVEIEDADLVERPPGAPWTLGPKTSSSSASQKARAANAWMADHSMLAPTGATANANKPVEAFRLTMSSSPEKKEPAARPGSALGNQIDDESDDDLIFGPAAAKASSAAAAKGSSAAARRKIGEKIGVLMSSLDSDEDHEPVALSERQRKLLKEGIAGLSGRPTRPPGEESSDDEIIIEEVGLDPKPKAPPSRNHQGGEESTSESETEALAERWKSKAAAMLHSAEDSD